MCQKLALVLSGLQGRGLYVYLDDIVLYADTLEEHGKKFDKFMNRLRKSNLHLQPYKYVFLRLEVACLREIID